MTGYGPQENWPESERIPFFLALEEEIVKAELAGKSILIELDANSKLGPQLIQEDLHTQSENGKLLAAIIERHGVVIGNSLKQLYLYLYKSAKLTMVLRGYTTN